MFFRFYSSKYENGAEEKNKSSAILCHNCSQQHLFLHSICKFQNSLKKLLIFKKQFSCMQSTHTKIYFVHHATLGKTSYIIYSHLLLLCCRVFFSSMPLFVFILPYLCIADVLSCATSVVFSLACLFQPQPCHLIHHSMHTFVSLGVFLRDNESVGNRERHRSSVFVVVLLSFLKAV